MPIDPSIPLQVQPNRIGEIFANAYQQKQQNDLARQQNNRQNRLLQLNEEKFTQEQGELNRKQGLREIATFSSQIKPLVDAGRTEEAQKLIEAKLRENEANPDKFGLYTELGQASQQGDFGQKLSKVIEQAQFEGLTSPPSKGVRKTYIVDGKKVPGIERPDGTVYSPEGKRMPTAIEANKPSNRGDYFTTEKVLIGDDPNPVLIQINSRNPTEAYTFDGRRINTSRITPVQQDVRLQTGLARGKESGKVEGKTVTAAKFDLPKVRHSAKVMMEITDKLLSHPAFKGMVGAPSIEKALQFVSGTDAAGFRALQKQMRGKTFLQAYETLKGAGQITEVEGEKATEAYNRMTTAASEKEFKEAAAEFKVELAEVIKLAEEKAGVGRKEFSTEQKRDPENFSGFKIISVE